MDFSEPYKLILIVFIVVGGLQYCSSASQIADLKAENRTLIDGNIALQVSAVANAQASQAKPSAETRKNPDQPLQSLEGDGLSIQVRNADASGEYCTLIRYQGNELFNECGSRQSRFTLLTTARYGLPVFKEEWMQKGSAEEGTSLGMTIWAVADQELVQAVHLPTTRSFGSCEADDGGDCMPSNERWLKATVQLTEDSGEPRIRYRYLTESGAAGEVNYRWDKKAFLTVGDHSAASVLQQYGF